MLYIHRYHSPFGDITMAGNGPQLTGLWFDGQKYFGNTLSEQYEEKRLPVFEKTFQWLDLYFGGSVPDFTPPLLMETIYSFI